MTTDTLEPLEGEQTIPSVVQKKAKTDSSKLVIALGVAVLLVAALGFAIYRVLHHPAESGTQVSASPPPSVAAKPSALKMPAPVPVALVAPGPAASALRVPELREIDSEAKPIPLRGAGTGAGQGGARSERSASGYGANAPTKVVPPEDAPIFSADATPDLRGAKGLPPGQAEPWPGPPRAEASGDAGNGAEGSALTEARTSLNAYKTQLHGLMDTLKKRVNGATGEDGSPMPARFTINGAGQGAEAESSQGSQSSGGPLFGTLEKSAAGRVRAEMIGDRSLTIPKGTLFLCSLKTKVISATSGFVGCQTERNVYSENGKVLLIERGSHMDGEYRIVQVKPGVTRVPVLWTRLRTPTGVVINLDSPATGALGESGMGGYVDNRWGERLGAALMLSLIQDAIVYATFKPTATDGTSQTQLIMPNTTTEGGKLAEQVLNTTINIPPLIYQNQGAMAGVYVAHDIDFSSVYALRAR